MGTEAEHAVLLTNYLTGLGRTTYLVLGRGVPEGKTAYCLTIEVGCFFQHSPEYSSSETGEWRTVALERSHRRTLFLTGDFPPTQVSKAKYGDTLSFLCHSILFHLSQFWFSGTLCPIQSTPIGVNPF